MIIKHFTKSKPNDANVIKLGEATFATEHREHNGEITHVGFKIKAPALDKTGHRYEVVFEVADLPELEKFIEMRDRLLGPGLPAIRGEAEEDVEDADAEDLSAE